MPWTVEGTTFVQQLERFQAKYNSVPNMSYALKVPPEHYWWYYQEHGHARGYPIFNTAGKKALAWTDADGHHVVPYVHEWGSDSPNAGEPKRFVALAMPDIRALAATTIREAFQLSNGEPQALAEALAGEVMPQAKELILGNVAESLPGSRSAGSEPGESAGKLGGRTAAQVLDDVISIEP